MPSFSRLILCSLLSPLGLTAAESSILLDYDVPEGYHALFQAVVASDVETTAEHADETVIGVRWDNREAHVPADAAGLRATGRQTVEVPLSGALGEGRLTLELPASEGWGVEQAEVVFVAVAPRPQLTLERAE
ncbi:MAG: hypothetical protein ACLFU2_11905, partial [Opitutales bacterium]